MVMEIVRATNTFTDEAESELKDAIKRVFRRILWLKLNLLFAATVAMLQFAQPKGEQEGEHASTTAILLFSKATLTFARLT